MEVSIQKSDFMEQDISESNLFGKEQEAQLEDTFADASKEHRPHECKHNSEQKEKDTEVPMTRQQGKSKFQVPL